MAGAIVGDRLQASLQAFGSRWGANRNINRTLGEIESSTVSAARGAKTFKRFGWIGAAAGSALFAYYNKEIDDFTKNLSSKTCGQLIR
ncbi:MAG: hypothetical protein ACKOPM_04285 [Novosphingobium sp.]